MNSRNNEKLIAYLRLMRIHRPIPILLMLLPILIIIFSQFFSDINNHIEINLGYWLAVSKLIFITIIGSIVTRSLGCIINDFFDKDIDAKTERAKIRPLVDESNKFKPTKFGIAILSTALASVAFLLALTLGTIPLVISLCVALLIIFYPITKRVFAFPQLFLGITYNSGIIVICSAMNGWLNFSSIFFYIINIIWTFTYDTVYAMQDIEDDKKNEVNSSAILLEENFIKITKILYRIITILLVIFGISIKGWFFLL